MIDSHIALLSRPHSPHQPVVGLHSESLLHSMYSLHSTDGRIPQFPSRENQFKGSPPLEGQVKEGLGIPGLAFLCRVTRKQHDAQSLWCRIATKHTLLPAIRRHSSSDFKLQNFIPKLRKRLARCYWGRKAALRPQFHISYDSAPSSVVCCAYF